MVVISTARLLSSNVSHTGITMDQEDALVIIVEMLRSNSANSYAKYGYELYIPCVIYEYLHRKDSSIQWGSREMLEASPAFLNAAWELCRRGILRPGITRMNTQSTDEGNAGFGYAITPFGRQWLTEADSDTFVPTEPEHFARLLNSYTDRFGFGFHQRAQEAIRCYGAHAYLACCAMCGAAAESVFLAAAIQKSGDAEATLATYMSAQGRSRIENELVGKAPERIQRDFRGLTTLLKYWRDASSHGRETTVADMEAYTSLALLLRFAGFVNDNWGYIVETGG